MPPKKAAKKKKALPPSADIIVTLEGVVDSAETSALREDTPLKQVCAGGIVTWRHPLIHSFPPRPHRHHHSYHTDQVLVASVKHRKLDPAPWRLVVDGEVIGPQSEDIITDVLPYSHRYDNTVHQVNATITF